jgi:hypothetical protein
MWCAEEFKQILATFQPRYDAANGAERAELGNEAAEKLRNHAKKGPQKDLDNLEKLTNISQVSGAFLLVACLITAYRHVLFGGKTIE